MDSPELNIVSNFPKDIPITDEGRLIAERLRAKDLKVIIFNTSHVGTPPESLVREYGLAELKTMEETWGSIDDYMDQSRPTPQNSLDEMVVGLGPNPKFKMENVQRRKYGITTRTGSNPYFDLVEADYNDVRGVDQSIAGNWVNAIQKGKIQIPPLNIPGLKPQQQSNLGKEVVIYLLNALRDKTQAFCIAKILDLYTHDRKAATLSHVGGVNHLLLPIILEQSYGINAHLEYVDGAKPHPLRQQLLSLIPPNAATRLISKIDGKGFTFDHPVVTQLLFHHATALKKNL